MTQDNKTQFLSPIANYYSARLAQHGQTARGADWNGDESQILRFEQLTKVIEPSGAFSLNDLGCGYGALYDYVAATTEGVSYNGYDISEAMIAAARSRHAGRANVKYVVASEPTTVADYGVASGIFNVRLEHRDSEWERHLGSILNVMNRTSARGFSFNCLTSYSEPAKMRRDLYYADPCWVFDLCKKRYSRHVALLHDYGLYEFTILVRKRA